MCLHEPVDHVPDRALLGGPGVNGRLQSDWRASRAASAQLPGSQLDVGQPEQHADQP